MGKQSGWRPTLSKNVLGRIMKAVRDVCVEHPQGATQTEINEKAECGIAAVSYGCKALIDACKLEKERGARPDWHKSSYCYRIKGAA